MSRTRGNKAETQAAAYLSGQGLVLLERNFSCKLGEIDLIMRDNQTLIFVEVRLRHNPHFGSGAETVTIYKQRKIIKTAQYYLQTHANVENLDCRFDVISIANEIDWITNAFNLDEYKQF